MAFYRRSIVWRLACDPISYLWSGIGDLPVPPSPTDPSGAIYKGAGALLTVPSLKQLINGLADRVEFTVSGVTAETVRLAIDDRETVKGASLQIGFVLFDENWQLIGAPTWEWHGIADILTTDRQSTENGGQRSITLSVAAADTRRANPLLAWFTDANQRLRSSTDTVFDRVAGITAGATRRFGPK